MSPPTSLESWWILRHFRSLCWCWKGMTTSDEQSQRKKNWSWQNWIKRNLHKLTTPLTPCRKYSNLPQKKTHPPHHSSLSTSHFHPNPIPITTSTSTTSITSITSVVFPIIFSCFRCCLPRSTAWMRIAAASTSGESKKPNMAAWEGAVCDCETSAPGPYSCTLGPLVGICEGKMGTGWDPLKICWKGRMKVFFLQKGTFGKDIWEGKYGSYFLPHEAGLFKNHVVDDFFGRCRFLQSKVLKVQRFPIINIYLYNAFYFQKKTWM